MLLLVAPAVQPRMVFLTILAEMLDVARGISKISK